MAFGFASSIAICFGWGFAAQGGGEGGHKNWKKRFFVLDNPEGKLDYFADEGAYQKGKPPLGTLKLLSSFGES